MARCNQPPLRVSEDAATDIGYATDLYQLLRAIDEVLPEDATLYLEGTSIAPAIASFLRGREPSEVSDVEPGTVWPKPRVFHLPLTGNNLVTLRSLAQEHAEPEIADHLVVYRGSHVLLWAHDAGDGHVLLSRSLAPETVEEFKAALGPTLRAR